MSACERTSGAPYRVAVPVDRTLALVAELVAAGELVDARRRLRDLLGETPQRLDVRERLAEVYRLQGHPEQAGRWGFLSPDVTPAEVIAFRKAFQGDPIQIMAALAWRGSEDDAATALARDRLRVVRAEAEGAAGRRLSWEAPLHGGSRRPRGGSASDVALAVGLGALLTCTLVGAVTIVTWLVRLIAG